MATLQAHAFGKAEIPPGSINLHPYCGLTYAPQQHGEGIRFAHNGRPVEEAIREGVGVEARLVGEIDATAKALGVSFGDVCDALKFLRDNGKI